MTTEQLKILNSKGWIEFNSMTDDGTLIKISKSLGKVLKHPNGNDIEYLKPKHKKDSVKNTFSYNYEFERFPLHTDTAFWEIPAKFVLLSSNELSHTATTIIAYEDIYKSLSISEISEIKKSIFIVKTATKNFYTSFINKYLDDNFIRFDSNCMKPVNKSAKITLEIIEDKLVKIPVRNITWDKPKVIIFDNWKVLHGREAVKTDEHRILKRIYIK
nr:TauD/TfdA family dioxygenase [Flavobacterium sp. ASV13]